MSDAKKVAVPAIRYEFSRGKVRIYIDDVLRFEAPWTSPKPAYPETDARLKRWADDLIADDSPDVKEVISGAARLVADNFEQGQDNVWRMADKKKPFS